MRTTWYDKLDARGSNTIHFIQFFIGFISLGFLAPFIVPYQITKEVINYFQVKQFYFEYFSRHPPDIMNESKDCSFFFASNKKQHVLDCEKMVSTIPIPKNLSIKHDRQVHQQLNNTIEGSTNFINHYQLDSVFI